MEPNKELPKEVVKKVNNGEGLKSWSEEQEYELFPATHGAQIAHDHYAPIIEAKDKLLSEKDKRIAELEADLKKVMGLLKKNFMGRQRLFFQSENINIKYPISDDMLQSQFQDYCKENGIDLGGE